MKVLIAADKFKGSLTSLEVCKAIAEGLTKASSKFAIEILPMSDGGDGLIDAVAYYTGASKVTYSVSDPLFRPVEASLLISADSKIAFVEMAQASGLSLLHQEEYNCSITTSFGTGELINKALESGITKIILGIGGSATNDCGIGIAAALGYRFLDKEGRELRPTGKNLIHIYRIDSSKKVDLSGVEVEVACDVNNLLTGPDGAVNIYAPQKGADPKMVDELEAGALHFADIVRKDLGVDILNVPGGGAAGGAGAGCVAFLNAKLISGVELVFQFSRIEDKLKEADLVITGEGKIDRQTLQGKLIHGITGLCAKHNKTVIAICGMLELKAGEIEKLRLTSAFSIMNKPMGLDEALQNAEELVVQTAFNIGRLVSLKA